MGVSTIIWFFTAFGHGYKRFFFVSFIIGALTFVEMTLVSLVQRGIEKEIDRFRHDMARQRGEEFSPPTPGMSV